VVPDHPDALLLLRKQLAHFDEDSWAANSDEIQKFKSSELQNPDTRSEAAPFSQHELHNGMENLNILTDSLGLEDEIKSLSSSMECSEYFVTIVFVNGTIYSIDIDCDGYIIVEDGTGGGGSGGSSPDPGDCDPTLPCFDGPGGSQPPSPGDDNPCLDSDPPVWCTDPCDTGDPIIDNPTIQEAMENIWNDSNFDADEFDRREQGGWIIENPQTGNIEFEPFPSDWNRTACRIDIPNEFTMPAGTVAMVHSHPYSTNEKMFACLANNELLTPETILTFKDQLEGAAELYQNKPSQNDIDLLEGFASQGISIDGYIIDNEGITKYNDQSNRNDPQTMESNERCGF